MMMHGTCTLSEKMATRATTDVFLSVSLKCAVCLELYTDPRVLPCLHTFCLHCLEPLVKNNTLSCPQCRRKHSVPKDGVSMYPVDLSLLPELGEVKEEKKICGSCTSGDVAVGYCTDCGEFLCEWCRDTSHKRNKVFISHTLVSLEDAPGFPPSSREQHFYCDKHTDHKLEVYCRSCSAVVCSMCMLELAHKNHKYDFIKNVNEELMAKIKKSTENVKAKEKELKRNLNVVEAFEKSLSSKRFELESEIKKSYHHCISILQKRKDQLLSEVDATFTQGNKKIWSAKNDIETLLLQSENCRSFSLRYQKQGHLLSLTNQLIKNLVKMEATKVDVTCLASVFFSNTIFSKSTNSIEECLGTLSSVQKLPTKGNFILKEGGKAVSTCTFQCKLNTRVKVCYTLVEPFARYLRWDCTVQETFDQSSPLVFYCMPVSDNEVLIECTPTVSNKYCFTLIAFGKKVCDFWVIV